MNSPPEQYVVNEISPLTPEKIASGYNSSIIVRRWLGAWVDFLVLFSFLVVPGYLLGNELYQKTIAIWLFLLVAYFPLSEGLTGYSLGKVVSGTKVVNSKGEPPGIAKAIIRTLARLIEVNPMVAGGIPAGIIANSSRKRQRLGDMLADTYVLKSADVVRLSASKSNT
jgi:uncharacterized RDD family membrane protein YckC